MGSRGFIFLVPLVLMALVEGGRASWGPRPRPRPRPGPERGEPTFWSQPESTPWAPVRESTYTYQDFVSTADAELRKDPTLSPPEECARSCKEGEPPKTCYYHFTLELYTTLGSACQECTPNETNHISANCQCVLGDGVETSILTINRMIPGPSIQVCEGDKIVIDVVNKIEGMEVAIHWHGLFQKGSQYYDGVPFVTQCPIHQGNTFRYQFLAGNAGTHFYHSHTGVQKVDGLHGSLIVRACPSRDANSHEYDHDLITHVVDIADWMHGLGEERFPGRLFVHTGQEPSNYLINGQGRYTDSETGLTTTTPLAEFNVTAGERFRFRVIFSTALVCPSQITVEGHDLTLIASDGESVEPVTFNSIVGFSGERYDFVLKADRPIGTYWIQLRGLGECGNERVQQLAILRYDGGPAEPATPIPTYDNGLPQGITVNPLDAVCNEWRPNAICVNQLRSAEKVDPGILTANPDVKIFLPFKFYGFTSAEVYNKNYTTFLVAPGGFTSAVLVNGFSYTAPTSPLLSQIGDVDPSTICDPEDVDECSDGPFCACTHVIDIPYNAVVEMVLVDEVQATNLSHPFHLHGYAFHVIGMGRSKDLNTTKMTLKGMLDADEAGLVSRQFVNPPAKDTIAVPNNGYVIVRFRADNPGYWFLHCHFLYHLAVGMDAVIHVGTQGDLPPVPEGFPKCGDYRPPITPPLPLDW